MAHPHTPPTAQPDTAWDPSWFDLGARAVRNVGDRQWHLELQLRFKLHPVVLSMLAHRPADWPQLLLEWPHVSETDSNQLAYTRSEEYGARDVQVKTSIGKYVSRHWPHVPDHVRRDARALYTPDTMRFVPANVGDFVDAVQNGPHSCMRKAYDIHPYSVYGPKFGWGMAVRVGSSGRIDGRALTFTSPDDQTVKVYVRSYARSTTDPEYGGSSDDTKLSAWLESQGFRRTHGWPMGAQLAYIQQGDNVVLPYIDGNNDCVRCTGEYLVICDEDEAEYRGENQDGTAKPCDTEGSIGDCEDCGDTVYESCDDHIWAGCDEDRLVCSCCSEVYTYITGARRFSLGGTSKYYVHDSDVARANGESYDIEHLPDNIVQLEDGDYIDTEVEDYCVVDDEYYLCGDARVVCCEDGEHRLKDDCWQCAYDDEWYSDDVDFIEADGQKYHPDNLELLRAEQQAALLSPELATA